MAGFKVGDKVRVKPGQTYYHDRSDPRTLLALGEVTVVSEPAEVVTIKGLEFFGIPRTQWTEDLDCLYMRWETIELVLDPPPTFASIEEADAWLEARTPHRGEVTPWT